jgi:hypothetical protein
MKSLTVEEFKHNAEALSNYGKLVSIRVPRQPKPSSIHIKKEPSSIQWPGVISQQTYTEKYRLPLHSSVGEGVKRSLVNAGHVTNEFFTKHVP